MMLRRFLGSVDPFFKTLLHQNSSNLITVPLMRFISCWNCGTSHDGNITCAKCQAIQDPKKINYFELFKIATSFDVNTGSIITAYHKLQKQFHPDKHVNESEKAREMSVNFSTLINKAYKTLLNPLDRGTYILSLNNISASLTTIDDPVLLSDVLRLNDEISILTTKKKSYKIRESLNAKVKDLTENLTKAFRDNDYELASKFLVKLKYYENLKSKVDERIAILNT